MRMLQTREKRIRLLEQSIRQRQAQERAPRFSLEERTLLLIALTLEAYQPGESSRRRALVKLFAESLRENGAPLEQVAHWQKLHKEEEEAWSRAA
jgi:4-alpha-glucanotransferase